MEFWQVTDHFGLIWAGIDMHAWRMSDNWLDNIHDTQLQVAFHTMKINKDF
jgi:hypothetical protein